MVVVGSGGGGGERLGIGRIIWDFLVDLVGFKVVVVVQTWRQC